MKRIKSWIAATFSVLSINACSSQQGDPTSRQQDDDPAPTVGPSLSDDDSQPMDVEPTPGADDDSARAPDSMDEPAIPGASADAPEAGTAPVATDVIGSRGH